MKRILTSAGLLATALLMFGPELQACGDKSLMAGGIRIQRAYAARFPASVLMYAPASSRLNGARDVKIERSLLKVGHKYHEVSTWTEFQASVASGQYNLVLADVADIAEVQQRVEAASSTALVIPVAYKLSKAQTKALEKECRFLIKAPGKELHVLGTIHGALQAKSTVPRQG